MPIALERASGVWFKGRAYVFGGLIAHRSRADIWSFVPGGRVRTAGTLAVAVHDAAAAVVAGAPLILGGGNTAGSIAALQRYAPQSARATVVGQLPDPLSDLAVTTVGPRMCIVGGYDGKRARDDVLCSTDGLSFRAVIHMPTGLRYAAVATTGERLLVAGGETRTAKASRTLDEVLRLRARLPVALAHAAVLIDRGTVVVLGGRIGGTPTARTYFIDLSDGGHATRGPDLPFPLADAAPIRTPTGLLLVGGDTGPRDSDQILDVRLT